MRNLEFFFLLSLIVVSEAVIQCNTTIPLTAEELAASAPSPSFSSSASSDQSPGSGSTAPGQSGSTVPAQSGSTAPGGTVLSPPGIPHPLLVPRPGDPKPSPGDPKPNPIPPKPRSSSPTTPSSSDAAVALSPGQEDVSLLAPARAPEGSSSFPAKASAPAPGSSTQPKEELSTTAAKGVPPPLPSSSTFAPPLSPPPAFSLPSRKFAPSPAGTPDPEEEVPVTSSGDRHKHGHGHHCRQPSKILIRGQVLCKKCGDDGKSRPLSGVTVAVDCSHSSFVTTTDKHGKFKIQFRHPLRGSMENCAAWVELFTLPFQCQNRHSRLARGTLAFDSTDHNDVLVYSVNSLLMEC